MAIQYQTDEEGNRIAVVIPIEEWKSLQERIKEPNDDTIEAMNDAQLHKVAKTSIGQLAKDWESAACES
jgi:hypothetical protein